MLSLASISSRGIASLQAKFQSIGASFQVEVVAGDQAERRIYAASTEFISRASDTPPNQPFLGTLEKPISLERSIVTSAGFGEISVAYGELELVNSEGDYDDLIGAYAVDGQRIRLKIGMVENGIVTYNNFQTIADVTATGWAINEDRLIISLRDRSHLLEVPVSPNLYAGTGELEGGEDLAGKRKPMTVGHVHNISPPLIIPGDLVYQVHDGSVEAIDAVRDAGGELINLGDYATSTLMRAAGITSGFVTCLAQGLFMLGASPFGKITADVRGANAGGYVERTADIIKLLILNGTDLTAADFDQESFDLLNTSHPAPIGYHVAVDSAETVAETISRLLAAIGGWVAFDTIGLLQARVVAPPSTLAVQRYDEYDLLTLTRDRLPSGIDPIIKRARVAYDVNWTVQEGTELIGDVIDNDPEFVSYLASPFRIASPTVDDSARIAGYHPLAIDPEPFEAFFVNEVDAQIESDTRMELYGVERSLYRFAVKEHLFEQEIGDTIYLQTPRLGLSAGKNLLVVQVTDNLESGETEIVGFG